MRRFALHDEAVGRARLAAVADPRFVVDEFEPCYRRLDPGVLAAKVDAAVGELRACRACPSDCRVDRTAGELGTCNTGRHAVVERAFHHFGEEDCLRGWNGSGTIFFGLCNLRCVFCQNWDISQQRNGRECTADDLAGLMLALQGEGCHNNINLVTPEHVMPQMVEAIAAPAHQGLRLPIVYNTSAYDSVASLRLMKGLVDIYMPVHARLRVLGAGHSPHARSGGRLSRAGTRGHSRDASPGRSPAGRLGRAGPTRRPRPPPGDARKAGRSGHHLRVAGQPVVHRHLRQRHGPVPSRAPGNRAPAMPTSTAARFPASETPPSPRPAKRGLWRFDERVLPW